MKLTSIACVAALASVLAGPVLADDRDDRRRHISPQPENWLSVGEIATKLEQQGYRLREIERDDGLYEIELYDERGRKREAYVDPQTGNIVRWDD